jgi:hypothetical protein
MLSKRFLTLLVGAACTLALLPMAARSSDPPSATLDASHDEVTWSGDPLPGANGVFVQCAIDADPRCDYFDLTADSAGARSIHVTVTPGTTSDEVAVFVHDENGLQVADSQGEGSVTVQFLHRGGTHAYQVRVQSFESHDGVTYDGVAAWGHEFDAENDCLQLTPTRAGVKDVTDAGQQIDLEVRVLLDGVTQAAAEQAITEAQVSYAPLGIRLVATYEAVSFPGPDAGALIQQAKDLYGGRRPLGVDVVYVMTNTLPVGSGGLADCIGGISSPETAFAAGRAGDGFRFVVFDAQRYFTAKVLAHEVAHLLGAHHHYGNCVEGEFARQQENGPAPCTLMFIDVFLITRQLSAVNSLIVRQHAVDFADF